MQTLNRSLVPTPSVAMVSSPEAGSVMRAKAATAAVAALLLGSASLLAGCEQKAAPPAAFGPMPVSVVAAQQADVTVGGQWVSTLDGRVNAEIQPQVTGYLMKQEYREGSTVQKGQILFQIDRRPFEAALGQAQGQLGQAQGQLAQAKAQLGLAQINVNRDKPLAEQRAIAQSQLDTENQQLYEAQANVQAGEASVAAAQASVATAKLNLGFTEVRSWIDGVAGQATTQVGNLVTQQSVLTSVSQLNPIRAYFSLSDSEYLALVKRDGKNLGVDVSKIPLTLTLADGSVYPHPGRLAFVDRQMNAQTGAIRIAAEFENPGNVLRPGQFARVSADTHTLKNVLLVPQVAVVDLQGVKQLYTVGPENKVHIVNVELGPQNGQNWVIEGGLQPGTQVILDNLQKLKEGVPVSPHPAAAAPSAGR